MTCLIGRAGHIVFFAKREMTDGKRGLEETRKKWKNKTKEGEIKRKRSLDELK